MAISFGIMTVTEQFIRIRDEIALASQTTTLVAVSKTYDGNHIRPVLDQGHRVFGENRVQEAKQKWPELRRHYRGIELHLIGPLQSNKAAEAVGLFEVIQTVDRPKIVTALAAEMKKQQRSPKLFVQVNTGSEPQKAGVLPTDIGAILQLMRHDLGLAVEGLMCIPPVTDSAPKHFTMLREIAHAFGLTKLSMGMSSDYAEAITEGATHVRVGSAIFGVRDYKTP
jgi:PLP dependent protein